MSRIPVWIDTDTGVDDAVALLTAVDLEKKGLLEIRGISAVCGNAELDKTFENARNVMYLAGREDVPVFPGAEKPLLVELSTAPYFHGEDGLGGAKIPPSPAVRESTPAWDALYSCATECAGELELILLGPETNAAIALRKHPDLPKYLKRILIMGGAEVGGNKTPAAEYNIWADPHGAQVVFKSGIPIVMCGLDVTMQAQLLPEEMQEIESYESRGCRLFRESTGFAKELYRHFGLEGFFVHDACPILYAAYPEKFEGEPSGVFVETRGSITRGKTVCDRITDRKFGVKNAVVVRGIDRAWFSGIIASALKAV